MRPAADGRGNPGVLGDAGKVGRISNPSDKDGKDSDTASGTATTADVADGLKNRPTSAADKRAKLIDRLLDSPDYPAYFALRWGTILRNSHLAGADQAAYAFHNWIKDMIARNRPYDEFVRGIVAAAGEWQDAPAINWYWQIARRPAAPGHRRHGPGVPRPAAAVCPCHHHPYERWGQDDYYGLAGFFTRLGRKSFGEPPPYFASPNVDDRRARTR